MKTRHSTIVSKLFPYAFLAALTFFACWLFAGRHGMFASSVDWISQHSVFPDYFRQQFYETGNLFPEFAASLGGGQNIYNFSYYGLLSPVILLSYLLPFVKMSDYLIAASMACLAAAVLLFYRWLKSRGFSTEICLSVSVVFLLAGPMIFQSCRQIMFVNYMPFLCMAFLGMDRYLKNGKPGLSIIGVFFMILTSFYFSIGGIFALLIYGMSQCEKPSWKFAARLCLPIAAATLSSGILLVPTACALLSGRSGSRPVTLSSLFIPDFSITRFAYSGYGVGLTAEILAVLLVGLFYKNKRERHLSALCLLVITIPFFSWLLNGGLYIREKTLIPFLPLLCYLFAVWLDKQKQKELAPMQNLAGHVFALAWCCFSLHVHRNDVQSALYGLLLIESILMPLCFLFYKKYRLLPLLMLPSAICLTIYGNFSGTRAKLLAKDFYGQVTDPGWNTEISGILEKETGLYRLEQTGDGEEKKANINRVWNTSQWISSVYSSICQESYQDFRKDTFRTDEPFRNMLMQPASENPLFQKLMGVKYLVHKSEGQNGFSVEAAESAAPVIYATNETISETAYKSLSFPDNQTALARQAVVEDIPALQNSYASAGHVINLFPAEPAPDLPAVRKTELFLSESKHSASLSGDHYDVQSKRSISSSLYFGKQEARDYEQLLYVQFDVKNHKKNKDLTVDLAGIRNKLSADYIYSNENVTFTYVIRIPAGQTEIEALFGAGDYSISNVKSFLGDASVLKDNELYQSEFHPDKERTKGNKISGEITVKNDGYLITSIPYDKGFELLMDGGRVKTQKVNTAFLGASIEKGRHKIDLIYHAPGFAAGKLLSCLGICLWIVICKKRTN